MYVINVIMTMSEKLQPNIESGPERGNNITLDFIFARHGEKESEGEESVLTKKGHEQATELGRSVFINVPKDGFKLYHSSKVRTKQTAEDLIESLMEEMPLPQTQTEKINKLKEKGLNVRIPRPQKWLGTGELNEESLKIFGGSLGFIVMKEENIPQDITSPRELASPIAKHVMRLVEASSKLPSDTEVAFVNVTHLPTLLAFLKNTIGQVVEQNPINPEGKNFAEKIGGPIDPAEHITLKMHRENPDDYNIIIQIRGKEFPINTEILKSLAVYKRNIAK